MKLIIISYIIQIVINMGILCQSCSSLINEIEPNIIKTKDKDGEIAYPKDFVSISLDGKKTQEETPMNFEEDASEFLKRKTHSAYIKNIIKEDKKDYSKLKSLSLTLERTSKKSQSVKLITEYTKKDSKKQLLYRWKEKRSLSLTNPKIKETDFEKFFSKDINISRNQDNEENERIRRANFKRKVKKSTTLMENANVLKQLFLVQMSIPVSQELLVIQQKGKPSDKYIRGKKLGSGTFGIVYKAKNILFNNIVAMKVIKKEKSMDHLLIKNEIDILKKLSHPNIVRIYEFYESQNNFYLINEYCDGGELFNYINKSTLNEQQLSVLFYQVLSGLCYLHENNILHRDMKPENILISKKEKDLYTNEEYFWIQIIDFGTAKIFEHDTKLKSIVGSAYYIAPEVLNQDYNEKCDTWSVGVILYMFIVGRAPFNGKSNLEIINAIKTQTLDVNNEKLLKASPEVRDLIIGLLKKDTNERLSAKQALNHIWFKKVNGRKLFCNFRNEDIQKYIDNLYNYSFHSKIQQLVIAFLVHNLPTTDSSRNILKLYRYFNESGDCKLTKLEFINGLSKYRDKDEVIQKVESLFILLDSDNNGFIEYEEFLRACIDKKEILTEEYLKYAFTFLDKENKGILTAEQINKTFLEKENKLFEIAISKDINDVDLDGDGNVNFEEFKILMTKTMH